MNTDRYIYMLIFLYATATTITTKKMKITVHVDFATLCCIPSDFLFIPFPFSSLPLSGVSQDQEGLLPPPGGGGQPNPGLREDTHIRILRNIHRIYPWSKSLFYLM